MRTLDFYLKSGSIVSVPLAEGSEVTWKFRGGELIQINYTYRTDVVTGVFVDITEVAAFMVTE